MIIDLSSNNIHPVTWPQVKAAGVQGVILKATQGTTYVNPDYAGDVAGASAAGLPVIAYHFADFTTATAEARFFLSVAGARARVLDSETNPTAAWQNAFLAALGQPQTCVMDYGSASSLPSGAIRGLLWVADYGPQPADGEACWQFTSGGSVPGIQGTVDESEWLGTAAQFDAVFGVVDPPAAPPFTIGDTVKAVPFSCTTNSAGWMCLGVTLPTGKTKTDVVSVVIDAGSPYDSGWATATGSVDYQPVQAGTCRIVLRGTPTHFFTGRVMVAV